MNLREMLLKGALQIGVKLNNQQLDAFLIYLDELKLWSKKMNLTGLKEDEQIITNHFLDSLSIVNYLKPNATMLDIGTGAGFPGIPVSIVHSDCYVTVMDSVQKKIMFVRHIVRKLNLQNVTAISDRAVENGNETGGRTYDFVATRAVSDISTIIKLCVPYLSESGRIIAMRGERGEAELGAISAELKKTGLVTEDIDVFTLPFSGAKRVNIVFYNKS